MTFALRSIDNEWFYALGRIWNTIRYEVSKTRDELITGLKDSLFAIFKFHQQHRKREKEREEQILPNLKIGYDLRPGGRIGDPVFDVLHVHLHPIHPVAEVTSIVRYHQMMTDDMRVF